MFSSRAAQARGLAGIGSAIAGLGTSAVGFGIQSMPTPQPTANVAASQFRGQGGLNPGLPDIY